MSLKDRLGYILGLTLAIMVMPVAAQAATTAGAESNSMVSVLAIITLAGVAVSSVVSRIRKHA